MRIKFLILLFVVSFFQWSCSEEKKAEYLLQQFIKSHESELMKLHNDYAQAHWDIYTKNSSINTYFNTSDSLHKNFKNTDSDMSLRLLYDNTSEYDFLRRMKSSGLIKDTILSRQLDKLYQEYTWASLDIYSMNDKQAELLNKFYALDESKPNKKEIQYLGSDSVLVYDKRRNELIETFKETIREKNKAAKEAGYEDFWEYWLNKNEITNADQEKLISSIDLATRNDYLYLKHIIDSVISAEKKIALGDIRYSDFYLHIYKMGYPACWMKKFNNDTIENILIKYFSSKGLKIDNLLENSDVWWNKSKPAGSFVINMDSRYDVRIYSNSAPNLLSIISLLHEIGHALYFLSVDDDIPFILREPNNAMNEGVGFMFQSLIINDPELRKQLKLPCPEQTYFKTITLPYMLFTTRDLLVRAELEKQIFKNPDQDLNKLFWELKKKYLFYAQSDSEQVPLWIQDRHIIHSSGIYQSYLYAAAIGSMLLEKANKDKQYGEWLKEDIFQYGDSKNWRDLLKRSTRTKLTTEHISNLYK